MQRCSLEVMELDQPLGVQCPQRVAGQAPSCPSPPVVLYHQTLGTVRSMGPCPGCWPPNSFLCIPCSSSTPAAAAGLQRRLGLASAWHQLQTRLPVPERDGGEGCPDPMLLGQPWAQKAEPDPGHGGGTGEEQGDQRVFPDPSCLAAGTVLCCRASWRHRLLVF